MEQIPGIWKTKNQKMADLCEVARELKDQFVSFKIDHVVRVQANNSLFALNPFTNFTYFLIPHESF